MNPVGFFLPPPIVPMRFGSISEKSREPRDPLVHELAAVDEYQGVAPARG